ncbi:oxygen-independent coproporphyrinogen III oxidase [Aliifodinibius sp. S!AR15-10]|uniref:oxygen-independent coproporphyrinogen III oxidase n=1 Tax=Aliifodinibius sp. S!AR15-10 TaxID=2950437 RepID=UPI00285957BB|nr:oxygen-independent coproporphyrinogen III oxidase [Aliifodinibius sp. S!AR15-10]MDR8390752.1 oxygen-independent coproporphyrinogen III oxidase [Aliifodinibius sp. S!AR15-10]
MIDVDIDLIKKYNVQGPRYTSYPTAVQFQDAGREDVEELHRYLVNRNSGPHRVSLYFHIPFCFSLCWYCGCNKVITKDQDRGDGYLDYLEMEMDQVAGLLHPDSEVVQVHFGGGTPTFLDPEQLQRLGEAIHSRFNLTGQTEFGVEIDPRRCTREHIQMLAAIGCNRASLGVQDTNEEVQQAIHRIQPFEQTCRVTEWLREVGISSINFDLIYGLPLQTLETFQKTMDDVLQLKPDRLAVYSYAHIPSMMPAQKLLNEEDMPSTDQKLGMLQLSISHLTENGYRFIGMDHFSREGEELTRAMDNGTLQRNFQGYSTLAGADLYAFGMSGISNVGNYYWQNTKDLAEYYEQLDENKAPVFKVLQLNQDDRLRKEVIMKIMCNMGVNFDAISSRWNIRFKEYFRDELERLREFEQDGLINVLPDRLVITEKGRLFLRNIAMCFDYYLNLKSSARRYSKTV